jgi:hypothetical protein
MFLNVSNSTMVIIAFFPTFHLTFLAVISFSWVPCSIIASGLRSSCGVLTEYSLGSGCFYGCKGLLESSVGTTWGYSNTSYSIEILPAFN